MRIVPLSDTAILIELGTKADLRTADRVSAVLRDLELNPLDGVTDLVPSYTTIGVHFDPNVVGTESPLKKVSDWARQAGTSASHTKPIERREIVIPVCYGGKFGPDLHRLAEDLKLQPERLIELHCEPVYHVRAIGFVPGFPYLAGLSKKLHCPRLQTPRTAVPAGSVAIGGAQTGVYPIESPGGWNLIGRTPLKLFQADRQRASLLCAGDLVRFRRMTESEFLREAEPS